MKLLMRLLREPLFHFIAIGGLIFLLFAAVDDAGEAPADVIVITPERIDQLAAGFSSVWKRMPTDDELDALIDEEVREEVYLEGWALVMQGMAILTPKGSAHTMPSAHDATMAAGRALAEADFSELRLARLLFAPGKTRHDLSLRACRMLARDSTRID